MRCCGCNEPVDAPMPDAGAAPWHPGCLARLGYEARVMTRQPEADRRIVAEILVLMHAPTLARIVAPLPFEGDHG